MRVGFLHLGIRQEGHSGVTRYGEKIAQSVAALDGVTVEEQRLVLEGTDADARRLQAAIDALSGARVVHLQYSRFNWTRGWSGARTLQDTLAKLRGRAVVTVHDVEESHYADDGRRRTWRQALGRAGVNPLRLFRAARHVLKSVEADRAASRSVLEESARVVVCTREERRRMSASPHASRIRIVPHFIERPSVSGDRDLIRSRLGLKDRTVVTLQGFIHGGKGHDLLIEALPLLPPDVLVVFAGGPPQDRQYLDRLLQRATELKVADRLRVTGYLSDQELGEHLLATDLAVSPFRQMSASGSLATWLAYGKPVLASRLDQLEELNSLAPGAIELFSPYEPAALAEGVRRCLGPRLAELARAAARLRELLAPENIAARHLEVYREVASTPPRPADRSA